MNAVEIEEAVSKLAEAPFDPATFPFAFLEAFGNKETTVKRLQSGSTNQSDVGGVLQRGNIHIKVCGDGDVTAALDALRASPATGRYKAKFILATDGNSLQAENLVDGSTVACEFAELGDKFGFFLPLAGITTVQQIAENAFDIKATGRLNRLYIELLKENPDWDTEARREDLNHFFARLIFCFFAEDTGIFHTGTLFTHTVERMSDRDASNVHEVLAEIFRAMNTRQEDREAQKIRSWAVPFPYVNGGLFSTTRISRGALAPGLPESNDQPIQPDASACRLIGHSNPDAPAGDSDPTISRGALAPGSTDAGSPTPGSIDVPRFTKSARNYLLHVGRLNWQLINPDIFGSMIQAVADDEERGTLGMHYTSVPNILKVLNPLFLDDLRQKLEEAGDNSRKLLNLRQRMARIRVFDPACGSGNFLVIAYKEMRAIEATINERRGEPGRISEIPLTNFRGIEIRHFSCEIARLALIIAEYQCDVLYRGLQLALAEFLPLDAANWITCGNALRLDWLKICPPTGTGVKIKADDLFSTPLDQTEMDFENEGGETYICGNPPYKGSKWQTPEQKDDLKQAWQKIPKLAKTTDYIAGWLARFLDYASTVPDAIAAFVATNSICQGQQAIDIWPEVFERGLEIRFAHTPFKWSNLASHNAGVTVVIIGIGKKSSITKRLFGIDFIRECSVIGPYLVPDRSDIIAKLNDPIGQQSRML